jgi:hypothetical protein
VLSVEEPVRGAPTIWVRYHTPGASWTEEIVRDSGRAYHEGETVTVVYDPADPEHVRTTAEANSSRLVEGFAVAAIVAGFLALPLAASAAWGWWRRARAVAETGWRIATVTVLPRVQRGQRIDVSYRDGSSIELRCVLSLHRPGEPASRRAWVGGWGRQMVVLFPYGPQCVPVLAAGLRA